MNIFLPCTHVHIFINDTQLRLLLRQSQKDKTILLLLCPSTFFTPFSSISTYSMEYYSCHSVGQYSGYRLLKHNTYVYKCTSMKYVENSCATNCCLETIRTAIGKCSWLIFMKIQLIVALCSSDKVVEQIFFYRWGSRLAGSDQFWVR